MLTKVEAQLITQVTGVSAVGVGAFSWLADVTLYLQAASALISVVLGLYAIYRIYKNYDK